MAQPQAETPPPARSEGGISWITFRDLWERQRRESASLSLRQSQQEFFDWALRNDPFAFLLLDPVVTVHPFDGEDEAVAIANGVKYGLSASVFTRDLSRAHRVAARLESGMVWVNTWLLRDLRVPFGGVKESGVGREGGRWSLEFFSEARNVCVKL